MISTNPQHEASQGRTDQADQRQATRALVDAAGVTVRYDTSTGPYLAVRDASFQVREHEKLAIIGPSGCGKTTLLMTVAGFVSPTAGRVVVDGKAVDGPSPERAVVFQDFDQLFPWRTVESNLMFAIRRVCSVGKQEARERAHQYLSLVGIEPAATKYPHQLSGGMKQRGAIARALAISPRVLLMDEPFGALDAINRTQLQRELIRIAQETQVTVILVTHSIQEAVFVGDRVLVMGTDPGHVKDVVDTSDVSDVTTDEFEHRAALLRRLLATGASGDERK